MFKILFTGSLCLILAYMLFWIVWWLYLVMSSIKIAEETKTPYDYIKLNSLKNIGQKKLAISINSEKISVYNSNNKRDFLYTIYTPLCHICTAYGVAIVSSPVELMRLCSYIYKLKRRYEQSNSMHKPGLFDAKFN